MATQVNLVELLTGLRDRKFTAGETLEISGTKVDILTDDKFRVTYTSGKVETLKLKPTGKALA